MDPTYNAAERDGCTWGLFICNTEKIRRTPCGIRRIFYSLPTTRLASNARQAHYSLDY